MVVRVRNKDIKDHATPKLARVAFGRFTDLAQRINNLQVTALLVVFALKRRHSRYEPNAPVTSIAVKPINKEDGIAENWQELPLGHVYARSTCKLKGDSFPANDRPLVFDPGEFGDTQATILAAYSGLRARAAKGTSGSQYQLKVSLPLTTSLQTVGGAQQFSKPDEGWDWVAGLTQEFSTLGVLEAQGTHPSFVVYPN